MTSSLSLSLACFAPSVQAAPRNHAGPAGPATSPHKSGSAAATSQGQSGRATPTEGARSPKPEKSLSPRDAASLPKRSAQESPRSRKASPADNGKRDTREARERAENPKAQPVVVPVLVEPVTIDLNVERLTLDNGLRVVLNRDRTSPTVAVAVTYDVGSRNEQPGRSGFAHLFEHMMFQGSGNVPRGQHLQLISAHGGVLNGTTSSDRTNYFEVLPSNELALALWLEADRMKTLVVDAFNFENQRKVVQEEYRMRVSNAPYAPSALRLEALVFQGYWPYEHPTIGSMKDLDGAQLEWVKAFHAQHYAPNAAVLSISGDFNRDEALRLVHLYFDDAPRKDVPHFEEPPFAEPNSARSELVRDDNVRTTGLLYGWPIPPYRSQDHYALEIAAVLLGDGESSELYQALVRDKAVAQDVRVGTDDRRGPDLFSIDLRLAEGSKSEDVERLVRDHLKAFAPSEADLAKAKRRMEAAFIFGLQSNMSRAKKLGEFETYFGDATLLAAELPRYLAVSRSDVLRVVSQYLRDSRLTLVRTQPSASGDAADEGPKQSAPASNGRTASPKSRPDAAPMKPAQPGAPAQGVGRP